jgi:DNA-binding XRE family transcriptional regulator
MKNQKLIEKLNTIAQVDNSWQNDVVFYEKNKEWLNRSAKIAIKILRTLRKNSEEGKFPSSQKELAELLKISPQQVNKIVRGSENLTIETICKIENVLNIHVFEYEMA